MRVTECLCVCKRQRGPGEPNQAFRLGGPVNTAWRLLLVGSEDHLLSLFLHQAHLQSWLPVCFSVCKMQENPSIIKQGVWLLIDQH